MAINLARLNAPLCSLAHVASPEQKSIHTLVEEVVETITESVVSTVLEAMEEALLETIEQLEKKQIE
jgi:hypothetical protein